jgi:hypothetical protein
MLEVRIFFFLFLLASFLLRSLVVSIETEEKYGFKIKYLLFLLFFGWMPTIGLIAGFFIFIITSAEMCYSRAKQTNKFILFICKNKVTDFFGNLGNILNKPLFGCSKIEENIEKEEGEDG